MENFNIWMRWTALRSVHSRPQRRSRVGRTSAAMRPIWRVIAAITPMRRPHAPHAVTVVNRRKSHTWVQISSAIISGTGGKSNTIQVCNELYIISRAQYAASTMNYYTSAARWPHCDGRNAADSVSSFRVWHNSASSISASSRSALVKTFMMSLMTFHKYS